MNFEINIKFICPKNYDPYLTGKWIHEAFEVENQVLDKIKKEENNIKRYLNQLLLIFNTILNDIRVPIFERSIIKNITKTNNHNEFIATVFIPFLKILDQKIYLDALINANHLMTESIKCNFDQRKLELIYQKNHREFIIPSLNRITGGRSTIPVLQICWEKGIPFKNFSQGINILGWGKNSVIVDRSSNDQDSAIGAKIVQRKDLTKNTMQTIGIPVPLGICINSKIYDLNKIQTIPKPWVVKPVDQDRGIGVTVNISNEEHLIKAIKDAAHLSNGVLVEEHINGICHRILVVNNQIINVIKRNPRNIIGNGNSSIQELIEEQNYRIRRKIPIKRIPEIQISSHLLEHIHAQGFNIDFIPQSSQKIELFPRQSTEWGGDPEDVTGRIHPDNAALAISAANLFRLSCAGIDFISTDISVPWHKNGAVINEINYAPLMGRTHEYQREGIRKYLSLICANNGKIPVEFFVGNALRHQAIDRFKYFKSKGFRCFYCDDTNLFNEKLEVVQLCNINQIYSRIESLRSNRQVDAIVVHINRDDSILAHGSPIEYIDALYVQKDEQLSENQRNITKILSNYLESEKKINYIYVE